VKAITFLGTGNYAETRYLWEGEEVSTDLFPHAVWELFHPEELLVFVTAKARERHWDRLLERLAGRCVPVAVDIPDGEGEAQLWTIFDAVVGAVEEGDTVLFDITHAFRSIPLIVLLAVAYLKAARGVRLQRLVYGAYDARDKAANVSPVFDLTPMVSLLDWLAALHLFREAGRGAELSALLRRIQAQAHHAGRSGAPEGLVPVGQSLERLSDCLRLIRPLGAMEQACDLQRKLDDVPLEELETWAKPFTLVTPLLKAEVARLAGEPEVGNLTGQAALLDWYESRGQAVQALTLAREMVVTWLALNLGATNLSDAKVRAEAEALLALWNLRGAGKEGEFRHDDLDRVRVLGAGLEAAGIDAGAVGSLWGALGIARNDVNHAGMRHHPKPADRLSLDAARLVADVRCLVIAKEHGIGDG